MIPGFLKRIWYRINPHHKDRLFCTIFGTEKYKKYALSLYNAVNGSDYKDLSDLEIITLENAVYIKMKNDVAYLISGDMALYEHQSSINPNMPVRGFMYCGELYSKLLKRNNSRIYGRRLIKIPMPQYIVFYNGEEDYPEYSKLKLSDAFMNPKDDGEFEFTATVLNINSGMNKELLDSCEPLKGYCTFVDKIREYKKELSIEEATDKAVTECISEDILRDVLSEERAAVMLEMLTAYDEKEYYEGLKEDFFEEGRAKGHAEGLAQGQAQERVNTERERERADKAEMERDNALKELKEFKSKLEKNDLR